MTSSHSTQTANTPSACAFFEYGCRASAFWNISPLARPYLEHLAEATGASAMLSTYENGHIVALDQAEGRGCR